MELKSIRINHKSCKSFLWLLWLLLLCRSGQLPASGFLFVEVEIC